MQSTEVTGRSSLEEMSNPTPSKQPDDFEKAETEKINKALKERIRQHIADEERLTQRAPIEEQQAETETNNGAKMFIH